MDLDQIPGLAEVVGAAEAKERELRELAFLPLTVEICGIEAQQFRPRHYQHLSAANSPFLWGGRVSLLHAVQFLWVVSPEFRLGDSAAGCTFAARIAPALPSLPTLRRAILEYRDRAWMDGREASKSDSSPIASVPAHLVHEFGAAYHWSQERTLETPFAALFQLQRLIDREEAAKLGRRLVFANRLSDAAQSRFLRAWRAEQKDVIL